MKARTCYLLLTAVLLLGAMACKKQKIKRKYTGDFFFTVNSHTWNLSTGSFDTTYTHEGRIVITDPPPNEPADSKSVYVQIDFAYNGEYRRTAVTSNGLFVTPGCDGKFINDDNNELDCVFYHNALSSSSRHTIHGIRR